MPNFLGSKHWVGFKKQAAAGTPEATVTTFLASRKMKMVANQKPIARKTYLGTGLALPSRQGWMEPEGSATIELMGSQPHPFYWALGSSVASTPTGATTAKLHTITDNGAPVPLTIHGNRVYDGAIQSNAYINKLKLSVKPGEIATLDLDWLSETHQDGATITGDTPVFVDDVLICTAVSVKIGGVVTEAVSSCEIDWDGGLEALKVLTAAGGHPQVIRRKSSPKVSGKVDFIDFPTAELAKLAAATSFELVIELQGGIIEDALRKFIRITIPACQYTSGLDSEASADVITGSANFEGFYDTNTARQILVEAQNTIADLTA